MRTPVAFGLVGLGGAVGGMLRYGLSTALPDEPGTFPWTTLGINLAGSFLLGFLVAGIVGRRAAPTWVRPALGTGLLGGFTTFSAVSHALDVLVTDGLVGAAALYLVGTLIGAVVGALLGLALGARLPVRLPVDEDDGVDAPRGGSADSPGPVPTRERTPGAEHA